MYAKTCIEAATRRISSLLAIAVLSAATASAYADKGAQHQTLQTRPSFLGVSGSNINFLLVNGNAYCYAGTLGSLVTNGENHYILSNNHVLAGQNNATEGDGVIQPGLLDENGNDKSCSPAGTDYSSYIVGTLSDWVDINFDSGTNYVDAAIASVGDCNQQSCIDPQGRILDIGGLQAETVFSSMDIQDLIGLAVQKSGRTTGLTTGTVGAVAANVNVTYDYGTAHYEDQLLVSGDKGAFIKAGDSGSLMATRPTGSNLPQAVGLLFAGSNSGIAIANRIDRVLTAFNVSMLGCQSGCDQTDTATGSGGGGGGGSPGGGGGPRGPGKKNLGTGAIGLDIAAGVRDRHESILMANPDVVGTGLSLDRNGDPVIQIYTRGARRLVGQAIPSELEGIKVQVVVTGEFRAL